MTSRPPALLLASLVVVTGHCAGIQVAHIAAKLAGPASVGNNTLLVSVTDAHDAPIHPRVIRISVEMVQMDMGTTHPTAVQISPGRYSATVSFTMAGPWRVHIEADSAKGDFDFTTTGSMMSSMASKLGPWSMSRDGSGTSWIPESSPMFMKMLPKSGRYDLAYMGFVTFDESNTTGPRGDHRFFSTSMPMLMATRETGGGILGLNLMMSLDPIFDGEYGYPDLFQTGETAHGNRLVDWQHPHNLLDEATISYSHPIGSGRNAFLYAGPVGEPALGGPTFMHRPSGMEIPEAPITHHWFDSTHISSGVVTAGVNSSEWQAEASAFNGQEPGENRYLPQPVALNSASGRVTFDPTKDLSFNTSYGFLSSPESTAPGVDQHRITAAALWSRPMGRGGDLAVSALFGRLIQQGTASNAYVLEATYYLGPNSVFARWENVDKDELIEPPGNYNVNKFTLGAVRDFASGGGFDVGVGGWIDWYAYPASLDPNYGKGPLTLGAFLRIRPSRMSP